MTAPTRPEAARAVTAPRTTLPTRNASESTFEHWRRAVDIRQEWLEHGLTTEPADRAAAEDRLAAVYARHGRSRPRFRWVDSPHQALPLLAGLPTHDVLQRWVMGRRPPGRPPLASDIAAGLSRLRSALDEGLTVPDQGSPRGIRKTGQPWPVLPPLEALGTGVPLREVLRQGVREALRTSLIDNFLRPVRAALTDHGPVPVAWYGQQDSSWIAYYDTLRRLGLARYLSDDAAQLDDWASLARTCGWWWPGEDRCVVVERPAAIRTRPVTGAWHGEVQPYDDSGPPVRYRDGWQPTLRPPVGRPRPGGH